MLSGSLLKLLLGTVYLACVYADRIVHHSAVDIRCRQTSGETCVLHSRWGIYAQPRCCMQVGNLTTLSGQTTRISKVGRTVANSKASYRYEDNGG